MQTARASPRVIEVYVHSVRKLPITRRCEDPVHDLALSLGVARRRRCWLLSSARVVCFVERYTCRLLYADTVSSGKNTASSGTSRLRKGSSTSAAADVNLRCVSFFFFFFITYER